MTIEVSRRVWIGGAISMLAMPAVAQPSPVEARVRVLEERTGGRLGFAIFDMARGLRNHWRADERFPMASTFKFLAVAHVLWRVEQDQERLDRRVVFGRKDLVTYSPATEKHIGGRGMTMADLCKAAVTLSDNTAGNLLLASFGGPEGLTAFARRLGDTQTRLDRTEPKLNEAGVGDPRDTTTPRAMLENMRKLLFGDILSEPSQRQLARWLLENTTGDRRLRAGAPPSWRVGDKTGTGRNGVTNDIGLMLPPKDSPILVTAYFMGSKLPQAERDEVIAEVGRIAASID
ncbi:beta-lactamase [Agaricicola taiwanensis]|uniref:Beta-lactamase n=1 Tax=Agaricicola taiwanensis TaxID=591372 RepID=A0A8J2YHH6_9RHOB|nr:class A beta-lactamase [Agaricicola taiwanensis]GGE42921.1 beta-lactamase [Agaricicola taiwanensis]